MDVSLLSNFNNIGARKQFGFKDKHYLQILASAASILLRNQELYEKSIISFQKTNALLDVARSLNSETDLTALIGLMMGAVSL